MYRAFSYTRNFFGGLSRSFRLIALFRNWSVTKATNMPSQYPWSSTMTTVAMELWKAKVPLKKIRAQLNNAWEDPQAVFGPFKGQSWSTNCRKESCSWESPHPCWTRWGRSWWGLPPWQTRGWGRPCQSLPTWVSAASRSSALRKVFKCNLNT